MLTGKCKKDFIKWTGEPKRTIKSFLRLKITEQYKIFKEYFESIGYKFKIVEKRISDDVFLYKPELIDRDSMKYNDTCDDLRDAWRMLVGKANNLENKR